jgi:cell wall-associated NlpC family hydrolase
MPHATLHARLGVIAATMIICLGLAAAPALASGRGSGHFAPRAATHHAGPAHRARLSRSARIRRRHDMEVHKVLQEARRQKGKPYVYGEDGPHGFDCSGLVRYVFLHAVHRVLPHNAAAQYHSLRHIRRSSLRPGDLVFVDNGGYVSHVGIYDGHHHWWVAPHTGTRVQRQWIYHAHFVYARVLVFDRTNAELRRHEARVARQHRHRLHRKHVHRVG